MIGSFGNKERKKQTNGPGSMTIKVKVVIILKAMAFLNLSTKNSNRGRELCYYAANEI